MFRIIGDEIEFGQKTIGKLTAPAFDSCRLAAVDVLDGFDPSQDERDREVADQKWRDEIEAEHAAEIENLEAKIEALETENGRLTTVLDKIDNGDTCLGLIAKAQKETADWRKIAEDNRTAYYEAVRPKPRQRRVSTKQKATS